MGALGNRQRERACQEYVLNGRNQSDAFRAAFAQRCKKWKDETIHSYACRLFAEDEIRARVQELTEQVAKIAEEKFDIDAEYILRRLVEIDRMDLLDILNEDGTLRPPGEWPLVWRQFINGMDLTELFEGRGSDREMVGILKKIKWPDKIRNLELLGKHVTVNAFREQHGHSGPDGGPIATETSLDPAKLSSATLKEILAARESPQADQ